MRLSPVCSDVLVVIQTRRKASLRSQLFAFQRKVGVKLTQ